MKDFGNKPLFWAVAIAVAASIPVHASAQSAEDRKTVESARAVYLSGPVPGSVACQVALDWDAFFENAKIPVTDETTKARVAKLKAVKLSVVSRDAEHTDIKIEDQDPSLTSMNDGLRQQLQGFFQMYWSMAYASIFPKPEDNYELNRTGDGYVLRMNEAGQKAIVDLDKSYSVKRLRYDTEAMKADAATSYEPGEDGKLRLRKVDETILMGETKLVVALSLDYQKVGVYEVPQHVSLSMPGVVPVRLHVESVRG